jgi:hypothetical protein
MASLVDAAKSGDRRSTLVALRDVLAAQISVTESGRDVAALSKRLMEVMDEIDALPDPSAARSAARAARERVRGARDG